MPKTSAILTIEVVDNKKDSVVIRLVILLNFSILQKKQLTISCFIQSINKIYLDRLTNLQEKKPCIQQLLLSVCSISKQQAETFNKRSLATVGWPSFVFTTYSSSDTQWLQDSRATSRMTFNPSLLQKSHTSLVHIRRMFVMVSL